jgi:hypothetical protein
MYFCSETIKRFIGKKGKNIFEKKHSENCLREVSPKKSSIIKWYGKNPPKEARAREREFIKCMSV